MRFLLSSGMWKNCCLSVALTSATGQRGSGESALSRYSPPTAGARGPTDVRALSTDVRSWMRCMSAERRIGIPLTRGCTREQRALSRELWAAFILEKLRRSRLLTDDADVVLRPIYEKIHRGLRSRGYRCCPEAAFRRPERPAVGSARFRSEASPETESCKIQIGSSVVSSVAKIKVD